MMKSLSYLGTLGHEYSSNKVQENIPTRSIAVIAEEIRENWSKTRTGIYFGAKPYLDAMRQLETVDDPYGADSGRSIVNYFLANAQGWKGETARRIKGELKRLVGEVTLGYPRG